MIPFAYLLYHRAEKSQARKIRRILTNCAAYVNITLPLFGAGYHITIVGGFMALGHLRKGGGQPMRITFHVGIFTVTIMIKKRENRHSGK